MAKTLSVNIDSSVAGALVGPVVYVSGTVSVVGSGPPFVHQVDQVTVQVGTGSQVTAQVTGPANLNTFPRSFSCVAAVASNVIGAQSITVSITGSTRAVQPMPQWNPGDDVDPINLPVAEEATSIASPGVLTPFTAAATRGVTVGASVVPSAVDVAFAAGQDSLGTNGRSTRLRSQR